MRRLSVILIATLTALLVAGEAGAIVIESGAVGANVVGANDGQVGRAKVLIIGDSVFDAFDHVASA